MPHGWKVLTRRNPKVKFALTETEKKQTKRIAKNVLNSTLEQRFNVIAMNDIPIVAVPAVAGAQIYPLNGMVKGDDAQNERQGNQIMMKHLDIRIGASAQSEWSNLRVLVLLDHIADLTKPIQSEIWTNFTAANIYNAQYNPNFVKRGVLKVLYDRTFACKIGGGANDNADPVNIRIRKKLNIKTHYDNSNTGTETDIVRNTLYLVLVSDVLAASIASAPLIDWTSKIMFQDA